MRGAQLARRVDADISWIGAEGPAERTALHNLCNDIQFDDAFLEHAHQQALELFHEKARKMSNAQLYTVSLDFTTLVKRIWPGQSVDVFATRHREYSDRWNAFKCPVGAEPGKRQRRSGFAAYQTWLWQTAMRRFCIEKQKAAFHVVQDKVTLLHTGYDLWDGGDHDVREEPCSMQNQIKSIHNPESLTMLTSDELDHFLSSEQPRGRRDVWDVAELDEPGASASSTQIADADFWPRI